MQVAISQKFGWEGTALLRKTTGCGQTEARSPMPRCGGLVSQGGGSAWCWWTASGRLPSAWTAGVSSLSLQVTNFPSQQDQQHRLHRHQQQHQKEQQQGIQRKPQILACPKHLPGENKCSAFYRNLSQPLDFYQSLLDRTDFYIFCASTSTSITAFLFSW